MATISMCFDVNRRCGGTNTCRENDEKNNGDEKSSHFSTAPGKAISGSTLDR
jgi:hypothetical protein